MMATRHNTTGNITQRYKHSGKEKLLCEIADVSKFEHWHYEVCPKTKKEDEISMKTKETPVQTPLPSPEMRSQKDIISAVAEVSRKKTQRSPLALVLVGLLAGMALAIASIATMSVTAYFDNAGTAKVVNALLFPFGLCIIIFMGGELYTGNSLMIIGILEKKASVQGMLYNWFWVYLGNFLGSLLVVIPYSTTYLMSSGGGALAVTMMKTAANKASLTPYDSFVLAILCNILVCIAVLICTGAPDPAGKACGAVIPISLFVMAGFEHCVANMSYIPLGILASQKSDLAVMAVEEGINVSALTVENFFMNNLIPVSLGNAVGGMFIAVLLWYCHHAKGSIFDESRNPIK